MPSSILGCNNCSKNEKCNLPAKGDDEMSGRFCEKHPQKKAQRKELLKNAKISSQKKIQVTA